MADFRIGLSIEHGEDRSYVVHEQTKQRWEIRSFDMKRKDFPVDYYRELTHLKVPYLWDLYIGLAEVNDNG